MAGYGNEGTEPGQHSFLDTLLNLGRAPATAANDAAAGSTDRHNDPSFTDSVETKVAELWRRLMDHPEAATAPAYPGPTGPSAQYTDRGGHLRGGTPGAAPAPQVAPIPPSPVTPGFTFPSKRPELLSAETQPPRRGTQ